MLRHLWLFGLLVVCHPLSDDLQLEAGDPEQLPSQLDSSSHSNPMTVSPCDEHQVAAVSDENHAEATPNPHLQMNASAEQDSNPGPASDSVAPALVSDDQPVIVVAHDIGVTPIQPPISSTDSGHSPPSPPLPPTTADPEDTPPPPSHPADTSQSGPPPPPPEEEEQQQQDAAGDGVDADETTAPPRLLIELNDPESVADIPTFNEWASKKVEETEKLSNGGASPSLSASDSSSSAAAAGAASPPLLLHVQHRQKNHASPDCSAKVLAANSESSQAHNVLSPVRDDYMLNPCNARNVFIVLELCEPVQVSRVELSNDELYSSSVRQFAVSVSDRYPTRDWRRVGIFTAEEKRGLQTFNISSNIITKFLRLDILSHYAGAGHYYCTLSSVRVFGANEYEVLDHQDAIHDSTSSSATAPASAPPTEVAVDEHDHETVDSSEKSSNIFHMAVEVVTTMVASATQAFLSEKRRSVQLCHSFETDRLPADTPAVTVQQLSCHWQQLQQLLWHNVFVRRALLVCRLCDSLATSACHASSHCTFARATLSPQRLHLLCLALSIHRDYSPSLPKNSRRPSPALPTNSSCPPAKSSHNNNSTYTGGAHSAFPVAGGGSGGDGGHRDGSVVVSEELEEKETAAVAVTEAEGGRNTSAAANLSLVSSAATDSGGGAAGGGGGDGGQPDMNERLEVENGGSDSVPAQQQQEEEETEEGSAVTSTDSAVNSSSVPSSESRLPAAADTTNWSDTKTATTNNNNNDATAPATAAATEDESGSIEDESGAGAAGQPLKLKESAFVRLGHRIRVLERNMSLSSQYLEELSRRYRRQVEDMQRTFNLTIAALKSTAREAELRDNLQQEMVRSLQIQLMDLSDVVRVLVAEKDQTSWAMLQRHLVLMALEVCVLGVAYCCCIRHLKHHHQQQQQQPRQQQQQQRQQQQQQQQLQRRQSTSGATQGAVNRAKRKQTVAGVAVAGAQSNRHANRHHRTASDETVYMSGCCNPAKTARQTPATLGEAVAASEAARATSLRELSSATEAAAEAAASGQRNGTGGCHSSAGLLFGTDSADSGPVTSHTRPAFRPRAPTLLSHNQYSLLSGCHSAANPAVTAARFGNPSNGHTSHAAAGQAKKFKQRERFSIPKRHL